MHQFHKIEISKSRQIPVWPLLVAISKDNHISLRDCISNALSDWGDELDAYLVNGQGERTIIRIQYGKNIDEWAGIFSNRNDSVWAYVSRFSVPSFRIK